VARVVTPPTNWRSLTEQQLQDVQTALERMKDSHSGQRQLHQLRVACRRAEAALRIFRDLLPTQSVHWLRKRIRKIRHSTNVTRDQDVLRKWLEKQKGAVGSGIGLVMKQQREDTLAQMFQLIGNLQQYHEHVSRVARPARLSTPADWPAQMGRRVLDECLHFLRCISRNDTETERLHDLRIASKRLRYACELATEVIPHANFRSVLTLLKQIQSRLGQIHDTAARMEQLKQLRKSDFAQWLRESRLEQQRLIQEWTIWWRSTTWENAIGAAATQITKVIRESR
jgi:CHAD domain-containing protein